MKVFVFLTSFLATDRRTSRAYKNIAVIFVLRLLSILVSFVKIPLVLSYLDPTRYGIWVTLTVLLGWFSIFNIGLGHGLRNRLAESLAANDVTKGRIYVSTTYAAIGVIFGTVFLCFSIVNPFLNWASILNTDPKMAAELSLLVAVVFFFFCAKFIVSIIETVANAKQEPWLAQTVIFTGNLLALGGIWTLLWFSESRLLFLGIALSAIPVAVSLGFSVALFTTRYREFRPSFRLVRSSALTHVMGLGVKFFVIQIAALVFYQTNAIIIAQLFGPAEVTPYQIGFAYFNFGIMGFMILLTPFWTAITDAFTRGEFDWIKRTVRNLRIAWAGFVLVILIQFGVHEQFIRLWVGDQVEVPWRLALVLCIYFCLHAYNNIFSMFINGIGKLHVQMWRTGVMTLLHIPLTVWFAKTLGIHGIMVGMILAGIVTMIFYEIQYRKIVNQTATGVWNR